MVNSRVKSWEVEALLLAAAAEPVAQAAQLAAAEPVVQVDQLVVAEPVARAAQPVVQVDHSVEAKAGLEAKCLTSPVDCSLHKLRKTLQKDEAVSGLREDNPPQGEVDKARDEGDKAADSPAEQVDFPAEQVDSPAAEAAEVSVGGCRSIGMP